MSQESLEVVLRVERAMGAGDVQAALAEVSPELTLREPGSLPWGGNYHGHQGMLDSMEKLGEYWEFVGQPVMDARDAGDLIMVRMRIPAKSRKTGVAMDLEMLELHTVVAGKIEAVEVYWFDTAEYLKQM